MSHNILKEDSVKSIEKCWHKLEELITGAITFANSGHDWTVSEYPVIANGVTLADWKALFRTDRNLALHVFKSSYGVIQNKQIWEAMENALQGIPYQVVTTGTLGNCKRTFISIRLLAEKDKLVRGDVYNSYLTFINSFDGFCTARLYGSETRVVCQNTLDMSLGSKGFIDLSVKHTANAAVKFGDMEKTVQSYLETKEKHFANLAALAEKPMSLATAENLIAGFVADGKDLSTRSANQGRKMVDLFLSGKGNKGETRYDLLNGVTEFYTHEATDNPGKALASNMLGTYAKAKVEFLDTLLDDAALNALANKGEALLEKADLSLIG